MDKLSPAIEEAGYGISGDIGGLLRQTYYTPDGRTIRAIASIRDYVRKDKDGKVVETGSRDANLDKGWLLAMPSDLKLYCSGCDKWHDTQEEIDACIASKQKFIDRMTRKGNGQYKKETVDLEQKVANLEALVAKLMEGKNG